MEDIYIQKKKHTVREDVRLVIFTLSICVFYWLVLQLTISHIIGTLVQIDSNWVCETFLKTY